MPPRPRRSERAARAVERGRRLSRQQPGKGLSKAVSTSGRHAQLTMAEDWYTGKATPTTKLEKKQAARLASLSKLGRVDPKFYNAFKQYFYHDETTAESDDGS